MNYPKISIITPSFNQGMFIEQTILSVLEQNYPALEYIIIDGGSTDNSVEIIKKYKKHLKYWVSEKDYGHSDAVNKGLKYCGGDIFNWLNSDDYYEPGALKKIAEGFIKNPGTLAVCGKERAFNSDDGTIADIYDGTNIKDDIHTLIYESIIDQPPTFFSSYAIEKLGHLPIQLHYTMDSWWWTKFLMMFGKSRVIKIPDILTNFRLHSDSKSISRQNDFIGDRYAIRLKLAELLELPAYVTEFIKGKTSIDLMESFSGVKFHKEVEPAKLSARFYKECLVDFYKSFNYNFARRSLYGLIISDFDSIADIYPYIIKLLLPEAISKNIRKRKRAVS